MVVVRWIVNKLTFPSPPSTYSLTSNPELFFVKAKGRRSHPGVPCMLYAAPQGANVLIVHAHSNGCDIADMRQTLQTISEQLRVHVMSFEYPGYGLHVGSPSMRTIDEAASAVLNFILDDLRVDPGQVVWYGRSIGSGPAIRMAHKMTKELRRPPAGLVVQCGFACFPEVAGHLFGVAARKLVSNLWPNEAMVKELTCPILILHGSKDTMIPISQSEKLWAGVACKAMSHFYPCDCGHNDFNFRNCTLKPLIHFLSVVSTSPDYPARNFTMKLPPSTCAMVHHVVPLRGQISSYNFRKLDVERWTRNVLNGDNKSSSSSAAPAVTAAVAQQTGVELVPDQMITLNGRRGRLVGQVPTESGEAASCKWVVNWDGGERECEIIDASNVQIAPGEAQRLPTIALPISSSSGVRAAAQDPRTPKDGVSPSLSHTAANPSKAAKKPKRQQPEPPLPIPDVTTLPMVDDVEKALRSAPGMLRICAERLSIFLERMQLGLDHLEGLEHMTIEAVVDLVHYEFLVCDPLLYVWEEVDLPRGDRVRIRVGPFAVDNRGVRTFDPQLGFPSLGGLDEPRRLRVPVWTLCPQVSMIRSLTEWLLLQSDRLVAPTSGCMFTGRSTSSSSSAKAGKDAPKGNVPSHRVFMTRGELATSYAAQFTHHVLERSQDLKSILSRFAYIYRNPEATLARILSSLNPPLGLQLHGANNPERSDEASVEEEPIDSPGMQVPNESTRPSPVEASVGLPTTGWDPPVFSEASRHILRQLAGKPSPAMVEYYRQLWPPKEPAEAVEPKDEGWRLDLNESIASEREATRQDLNVANALNDYERFCVGRPSTSKTPKRTAVDPESRKVGAALLEACRSFQAFCRPIRVKVPVARKDDAASANGEAAAKTIKAEV